MDHPVGEGHLADVHEAAAADGILDHAVFVLAVEEPGTRRELTFEKWFMPRYVEEFSIALIVLGSCNINPGSPSRSRKPLSCEQ